MHAWIVIAAFLLIGIVPYMSVYERNDAAEWIDDGGVDEAPPSVDVRADEDA